MESRPDRTWAEGAGRGLWGLLPAGQSRGPVHHPRVHRVQGHPVRPPGTPLRVITLNLAHGRGNRLVQRLVRRERAERHLDEVAGLLRRAEPHAVALQEADARALWSGRFNHVDFLARRAGYGRYTQMRHVDGLGLAYGTALMARVDLRESEGRTFRPSPPTFAKGWVSAVMPWPAAPGGVVRLVSLHLDFSRSCCRASQLQELAADLAADPRPLVLLGDFNSSPSRERAIVDLMERLGLHTVAPHESGPPTHPATRRRIDWILVSRHLRFERYEVLPAVVSDHLPVLAELVPARPQ